MYNLAVFYLQSRLHIKRNLILVEMHGKIVGRMHVRGGMFDSL